ncbi:MAG: YidB family protein, partial [Burkholderiaceae bacterium]|nr:YidB family protein [Burkholderiaceae bacterium]
SQLETVLGASGGLLPALTAQLGLPRDQITQTIGYLLPTLVGHLTPGGNLPANPPADIASYAQAGQGLLAQAAQAMQTAQRAGAGGGTQKWLIGVIVIIIVLAALYAWNANRHETPKPIPAPPHPAADIPKNLPPHIPQASFGLSRPTQPASAAN